MAINVHEYLEGLPPAQKASLERLRAIVTGVATDATETISYGMPTYKWQGKTLVHFAAFKNHCSLFPASGNVFEAFDDDLADFKTSKGTIQFAPEHELPEALVRKILEVRMKEIEAAPKK